LLQEKDEAPASSRAPSVTSVADRVLATASSQARVSAMAIEALVSVAAAGVTRSSQNGTIVMVLGA
jgi:hypothetical protein